MMMMFLSGLEAMMIIGGNIADLPDIIVPNECFNVGAHTKTMEANDEMLYIVSERQVDKLDITCPISCRSWSVSSIGNVPDDR